MDQFIEQLRDQLQQPLPGRDAQFKMAHVVRQNEYKIPDNAKKAGVLALFYPKEEDWHIAFIERVSSKKRGSHSGQISFPGGKFEDGDQDLVATAIRETQEEIGVASETVQILGELSLMYIPVSNFLVNPVVGFVDHRPNFKPQPTEVHQILEVPFNRFLQPETTQVTQLKLSNNIILNQVPYYDIFGKVLWGATAMMMSELIEVIS